MNIRHHFDDATLVTYASGALPAGMALLVSSHLAWCERCREQARCGTAIGGALLEQTETEALSPDALDRVMALLDEPMNETQVEAPLAPPIADTELPVPLAARLGCTLDELPWRRLGYGVQQYDLGYEGSGATRLLRIAPGVSVPHHGHRGNELTLILRGSYSDELGRFCRGDVADVDSEVKHQPIVDTDKECICLIATDAPLRFTGLMGRLVQPFIGL